MTPTPDMPIPDALAPDAPDVAPMSAEEEAWVRERCRPRPRPVCRVCGGDMTIGLTGPQGTKWRCANTGENRTKEERDHYERSSVWQDNRGFEPKLLASLDAERTARLKAEGERDELRAQVRWTPVAESLPAPYREVLVLALSDTHIGYLATPPSEPNARGKWYSQDRLKLAGVTHWMPKPALPVAPPEEGGEA